MALAGSLTVAAASILAREAFIDWMQGHSRELHTELPRGASAAVKSVATALVEAQGADVLRRLAKVHFKTAAEVAPQNFAKPDLPVRDNSD